MARPQRQGRSSISYKEDHLDEDFGIQQGAQQGTEQTRAKRTLTLKRSSRTQDRAEAKQLERAITESLNSSCEKTYIRGGLERSARGPNHNSDLQTEVIQLDGGREPSDAFQVLVDAASADNSTILDAEPIRDQGEKGASSPGVQPQTESHPIPPAVTGKVWTAQASEDLKQLMGIGNPQEKLNIKTIAAAEARTHSFEHEWDNEEAGCSESDTEEAGDHSRDQKGPRRRSIVMNNHDEDEWSGEEESESDEDDEDVFAEDSDDSDCGKGGSKRKRRTSKPAVKPAAKKPPSQTLRRVVSNVGASSKQASPRNPKQPFSGSVKEPVADTKRQKPGTVGQENVAPITAEIAGQEMLNAKRTPGTPAKVTPESQKSMKASNLAVSPASNGLQHPRLPLHTISTTISPTTPGSGPPLHFPSTQHRRVLGLSKRFQPPPLHPYLHGTS